jgi:hypothetical protein
MSATHSLDLYVRLCLGLPDPGMVYSDTLAHTAARAGLRLDGFTASEKVRIDQIVQERNLARQQKQERTLAQSREPERARSAEPKR